MSDTWNANPYMNTNPFLPTDPLAERPIFGTAVPQLQGLNAHMSVYAQTPVNPL